MRLRTWADAALRIAVVVLAVAVLFTVYWRQSGLAPVTSDGAGNALQARDMLHGNLLLHNWWVSDVSFYTTELPQYMLIEAVLGLGPWVVHVAAAMTYTLLVLLAALLAKGGVRGRAGLARALLAAGIILAPQLSVTQILLLAPDHTGTAVPLLLTWLVIDRAGPGGSAGLEGRPPGTPRSRGEPSPLSRWTPRPPLGLVPVVVCVMLTWTMVADSIVLITGIAPLVLVCVVRTCPGVMRRGRPTPRRYELSLAGAAVVAAGLGSLAPRVITALGGYQESHVATRTAATSQWLHGAWVTFQALLELFGADVFNARPGIELVFVALHLAGAITAVCALFLALRQFFRLQELMIPVFAVAILLNLGAYMISPHARSILGAREMAAVLPLGAVLAGRMFGERVLAAALAAKRAKGWFLSALTLVAAGYLGALAYGAAQPAAPADNQPLAAWLVAHRLTDGLAGYWQANSTTLDSGGRVLVSGVTLARDGDLAPYLWETDGSGYHASLRYANFVVADGPVPLHGAQPAALRTFGRPQRVYHYDGYTVLVWDTNLLRLLG